MLAAAAELQRGLEAEGEMWMVVFKGLQTLMPPLATAQLMVACFPCELAWGGRSGAPLDY